ncbi:hypothetical protein LCGC14_0527680 [marine sediment metagenome]|uniref:Uncharacterized protein n=1 Tax=marine sediment metagenome TaxID=412755 RepID=A0A0F9SF36_9ZZZZ
MIKAVDLITKPSRHKRDGIVYGKREEADTEGMVLIGEVETWPKYCVRWRGWCIQCHLEGKILCHPRFR